MSETFEITAKTFQGLEGVLADELKALGAEKVEIGRRMVSFEGDKKMLYKANFCLHTALRVLKPIFKFEAGDADQLYEIAKGFEWDKILSINQTFSIDSTVNSDEFRHSRFVTYRVKDAIADYFSEKYGKRPSIRIQNADIMFNVHITATQVTISLDSSGESLHKRGYRVGQTEAPINEVLAAGLLKLAGWDGTCNLLDPMCGSGTILIEAALLAANINPGVYRNSFAFERWPDFDSDLFESIYSDDSEEKEFEFKIHGSDISPKAVDIARNNIKNAGVSKYVSVEIKSLRDISSVRPDTMLVSNPPYGERLELDDITEFYNTIGNKLKNVFKGCNAWLIGPKNEIFDAIGLKPSVKFPILNGSLECEFREYVIFDGKYADFRKEGKSVANEDFRRPEPMAKRFRGGKDSEFRKSDKFSWGDRKFDKDKKDRFSEGKRFSKGVRDEDSERRSEDRKTRSYGRRPEPAAPRNALEAKYRKPLRERLREEQNKSQQSEFIPRERKPEERQQFAERFVKFKQPTLGEDTERKIATHRRNSWKRADAETKEDKNND